MILPMRKNYCYICIKNDDFLNNKMHDKVAIRPSIFLLYLKMKKYGLFYKYRLYLSTKLYKFINRNNIKM